MEDLFSYGKEKELDTPLAFRSRPTHFDELRGQDHLKTRYPFLFSKHPPSMIIFGPPGTGKTTLAYLIAQNARFELRSLNAVLCGVADLKKAISELKERPGKGIVFIDEIHRFNRAQQDALLPFVERGEVILIGATTENPRRSVNEALLSRTVTVELKPLSASDLEEILEKAAIDFGIPLPHEITHFLAFHSGGDARKALNFLEVLYKENGQITFENAQALILANGRNQKKWETTHYDLISGFIKSMRGSSPDGALYYLAALLDAGEDPVFIARRMVVFASEDVGNSDPQALTLAISALQAAQNIGMPEVRINLAQVAIYLAATTKSNASYLAIDAALLKVRSMDSVQMPLHLKNHPSSEEKKEITRPYLYPHDFKGHFVDQNYLPFDDLTFYHPTEEGIEKKLKERLEKLWPKKNSSI